MNRICKKFRGGFNFVVFMDDKDPRNLLHFLLTSIDGETNNMMYAVGVYMSGNILDFLNSMHNILRVTHVLSMALF